MINPPRLTVLMPVFNDESFLEESINSILSQTFVDFEFIIIDDGSADRSNEIIRSYNDRRILYIRNNENSGVAYSLNKGLALAKGKYIARMDSDDISLSHRFSVQVKFLEENKNIGVCGGAIRHFGSQCGDHYLPLHHEEISAWLLFKNVIAHPSVMFRKDIITASGLQYNHSCAAEDYDLWSNLTSITQFANLNDIILHYRIHPDSTSSLTKKQLAEGASEVRRKNLRRLNIDATEKELSIHCAFAYNQLKKNALIFHDTMQWLKKLHNANAKLKVFSLPIFSKILLEYWFAVCLATKKTKKLKMTEQLRSVLCPFSWNLSSSEMGFVIKSLFSLISK